MLKEEITYDRALTLLGKKNSRYLQYQTYLIRGDNRDVHIRHWQTNIITYKPDGSIVINLQGWETVTTKKRIRIYTPVRMYSYKGTLAIWDMDDVGYEFEDGIIIESDGSVKNATPLLAISLEKITGRNISSKKAMIQFLEGMDLDMFLKIWKKFKKDRNLIARYCPLDFLPLTMGSPEFRSCWEEIVTGRLRRSVCV